MRARLRAWTERGWLRAVDEAFATFLWREVPDAPPLLILAAALASHQLGRGHVCLDLKATLQDPSGVLALPPDGAEHRAADLQPGAVLGEVTLDAWLAALACPWLVAAGEGDTPLVLEGTCLYLRRYWRYERAVQGGIEGRLALPIELPSEALRVSLTVLFPKAGAAPPGADWQKIACALAARSAFCVVTGGPGTGKTTTVVKLLALLQAVSIGQRGRTLRIRLAAPTGKAAARLNESVAGALRGLSLDGLADPLQVREAIPVKVTTLHRLFGSRADTRGFHHDGGNLLPLDVLVIDEASMVDLEMMAAVFAALAPGARLVLLGDKDQLASVEAGAVLGKLCRRAGAGHYTERTREWIKEICAEEIDPSLVDNAGSPLDQAVAMLRVSHRFAADSGIGQLASSVNSGDFAAVEQILQAPSADLARISLAAASPDRLRDLVIAGRAPAAPGYRAYLDAMKAGRPERDAGQGAFDRWACDVLRVHAGFQVLCALRRGPWGVEGLNRHIAEVLRWAGLISATEGWYIGRPVLVTRNDPGLGLSNGDIGIALELPFDQASWSLRVAFAASNGSGGVRWILPSRLQSIETAYALTVHKSQGSEFDHVALVLPEEPSSILTRELLYTGITRARSFFTLADAGGRQVLKLAVERRMLRSGGSLF